MSDFEFITPLEANAIDMHEIFEAYKSAGFSSDEALTLVGIICMNND